MKFAGARFVRKAGLLPTLKAFNRLLRRLAARFHRLQFEAEWRVGHPPEWFDHFIDQYWKWNFTRNSLSWERGVFGTLAMKPDARVLDLCCGGGFTAYHFLSGRAGSVVSVDFDPNAIAHAQNNFKAPNLEFRCADIRSSMPEGSFDHVVWDAAIEHFTEAEIDNVLRNIKNRIGREGILTGYTLLEREGGKSHVEHEYEFKSKEDLARFLKPHFENVLVFQTTSRDVFEVRDNLYFYASDGTLPFDGGWDRCVRS